MVRAQIGDVMKVTVHYPHLQTLVLTLQTQAAADYATQLLNDPNSGWRLERPEKETPDECGECDTKEHCKRPYGICVRATANRRESL